MTIRKLISGGCALQANMDAIESVGRHGTRAARRRLMSASDATPERRPSALRYVTRNLWVFDPLLPLASQVEARFRYAIPVADRSEAGRRPLADLLARASSLLVTGQIPARCRSATSFGLVCDQDSVMEFGL